MTTPRDLVGDVSAASSAPGQRRLLAILSAVGRYLVVRPFQLLSLIVILAVVSSVPVLQLITLGYLLDCSARVARSGKLTAGLPLLRQAGIIGSAAAAMFLLSLPIKLLGHWAYVAELVNPDSPRATVLRVVGAVLVGGAAAHIGWTWYRGARGVSYLRPRPIEFVKHFWRWSVWIDARDRLWDFVHSLHSGKLFWLGARCALGTMVWLLVPGFLLIVANGAERPAVARLLNLLGLGMMALVMLHLPLLQANFAVEDRWRAMFAVRRVRQYFRSAPILCWLGLTTTLIFAVPLYLLKIEATPQEVVWIPCVVMVAFMLPARIITGFAVARACRSTPRPGVVGMFLRGVMRMLCVPVVMFYLLIVFLSTFTSWDGLATWFQQHAVLVPVPFGSGL